MDFVKAKIQKNILNYKTLNLIIFIKTKFIFSVFKILPAQADPQAKIIFTFAEKK